MRIYTQILLILPIASAAVSPHLVGSEMANRHELCRLLTGVAEARCDGTICEVPKSFFLFRSIKFRATEDRCDREYYNDLLKVYTRVNAEIYKHRKPRTNNQPPPPPPLAAKRGSRVFPTRLVSSLISSTGPCCGELLTVQLLKS